MTTHNIINTPFNKLLTHSHLKIKLGAIDGSGFFFCGDLKDIDTEHLNETIINGLEKAIQSSERTLTQLKNTPTTYNEFKKNRIKAKTSAISKTIAEQNNEPLTPEQIDEINEKFDISKSAHEKWKQKIRIKIRKTEKSKAALQKDINKFTSITNRKILAFYPSIDERDTYICIIEGHERGFAWTTGEYERGYGNI